MVARDALWEVALDQHGFVTTADARAIGLPPRTLKLLAHRGALRRESQGVYHFVRFPVSSADEYQAAVLWTGRAGAVLSHETVLSIRELCDANPTKIHVTVPVGARVRRQGGERIALHEEDLVDADRDWWEGIPCATDRTAIRQSIAARATPVHLIRQAITTARARGSISAGDEQELHTRLEASLVA